MHLSVEWLGRVPYREAWARQREIVAARHAGTAPDTLLLLEHEPVLTLGRHGAPEHVLASADELRRRGIEVIRVERGGEVTYHGPGQLVAYPIVRLRERGLLLRPFVRALERAMIKTAAEYGVAASIRPGYPGVWIDPEGSSPRKLGALGLRIEQGISYHGVALNITTQLRDFGLIEPCGMVGLNVTSVAQELGLQGWAAQATTESVHQAAGHFAAAFRRELVSAATESGSIEATPVTSVSGAP